MKENLVEVKVSIVYLHCIIFPLSIHSFSEIFLNIGIFQVINDTFKMRKEFMFWNLKVKFECCKYLNLSCKHFYL